LKRPFIAFLGKAHLESLYSRRSLACKRRACLILSRNVVVSCWLGGLE
jgi:hypothetical protein